ncbi:hypothetical protein [uncultured Comamonas sp.]|uniref:hypothetical protein n=1 Tax=uncultured Comamonas sp. TaxID=114710 RepID=UPI002600C590|nr:hypothetical protein [uncultured Comamonas sp.]
MKLISSNTMVRWAVHPADQGRITYIDGLQDKATLPYENEVITRPFLVDPVSKAEVPVRVVQLIEFFQQDPPVIAVVVAREQ